MPQDDPHDDMEEAEDPQDDPGEPLFAGAAALDPDHETGLESHSTQFGTPAHDAQFWHRQSGDYTCAVEAQAGILECLTGEYVNELDASVESAHLGYLTTDGTMPDHIGRWLEYRGIECHANDNGTFLDVMRELRSGHKVIVDVNADALWNSNDALRAFGSQAADHAIWLTGVDASDADHVKIVVNDSGRPDGAGMVYDLHELEDVINMPGLHYVATGHGPSHLPEEPVGYDSEAGVFSALDSFLEEHGIVIAGVTATAAAAAAALRTPPPPPAPVEEPLVAPRPAVEAQPRPALPAPSPRLEDLGREERDRLLRRL